MSCCGNKRAQATPLKTNLATPTSRPFAAARPGAEGRPGTPAAVALPAVQRTTGQLPAVQRTAGQLPAVQLPGTVRLRYLARAPILVRGAGSGAAYRFSESQPVVMVQRADADALVATGHFRREG